jgi:hypothetical protein
MPLDVVTPEIRRYLLGDLDEARAAALEDRYVADPVLVDDIRTAEEALIEAFLDGRLGAADRVRFEAHYLASPVHRDRVAIARALRERPVASVSAPPAASFYAWVAMAAAVVLASLWIVSRSAPAPQQVVVPPSPSPVHPAPGPAPPIVPAPAPAPPSLARAVLALTLSPLTTRGGEEPTSVKPAGPVDLVLRLEGVPAATDRTYEAELQIVDGRALWRGRGRAAAAGGLLTTLRVPADTLPPDDYVVVVTAGREERGRYVLRLRSR